MMASPSAGIRHHAGNHLYPDRRQRRPASPHLHRRTRLARPTIEPTYQGYSIGRWIDEDGDGRYDVLEVETRGPFKGPRAYDASGLPLHFDNQSIFKERFHLDKADPNILHDEITVIDHALTRPWTVDDATSAIRTCAPNGPKCFASRATRRSSSARRTIS